MSFRRARVRQLKHALEAMGAIRDTVVVNIISYAHLPLPKYKKPKESPREKPRAKQRPVIEKPEKPRKVIHCHFDGVGHIVYPGDSNYESIYSAAPGDRPKLFGRREGGGKLKYPDIRF